MTAPFSGVVLTGGASRRMGRDKALLPVDGVPMAVRVAAVLARAGATEVLAVGGDLVRLRFAGLDARADPRQGAGPLGGLLTAFEVVRSPVAVVLACDLPWLTPDAVAAVMAPLERDGAAGDPVDAVLARTDRIEPLCAAWRVAAARPVLQRAFDTGERAIHATLGDLRVLEAPVEAAALRNVNRPDDLRLR